MKPRFVNSEDQSPKDSEPDLVLWFDKDHFNLNSQTIDNLHRGDKIKFRGQIKQLQMSLLQKIKDMNTERSEIHQEDKFPHINAFKITMVESAEKNGMLKEMGGKI